MRFKKYSRLKTCRRNISGGGGGREGRVGFTLGGVKELRVVSTIEKSEEGFVTKPISGPYPRVT